jgi:galactofuranose transport system substrate-binding protein
MKTRFSLMACAIAVLFALTVIACGDDDDGSAESSGENSGGAVEDGGISVEPRTIGVVNAIGAADIEAKINKLYEEAGRELGWEIKIIDGAGDPGKMVQAAQSLVNQNVDALLTTSIESAALRGPLLQAKSKGIPTISTNGGTIPSPDLFTAQYEEDEYKMGSQLAEWANEQGGEQKIANLQSTLASSAVDRDKAWHDVFPDSAFAAEQQVDPTQAETSTQSKLNDMLTAHPDVTLVHAVYDDMTSPAAKIVTSKNSDAVVVSYFHNDAKEPALRDPESPLVALSDNNLAHTGAVALDQLLRHFELGEDIDPEALEKNPLTYRVVTKENVDENPPFEPSEVLAPFLEQWAKEYPAE